MESASGLVTLANLILCAVVGLRLLKAAKDRSKLPELALGTYFLVSAFLASIPQIVVYGSLGQESLILSEAVIQGCLGAAIAGMAIGAIGIFIFTWRSFHADSRWARALAFFGCFAVVAGWGMEAVGDGFRLMILPGIGHWVGWAARTGALVWVAIESFRYYALQRRRLRLGLTDPILANRFLLWGIWSITAVMNFAADLVARSVYIWMSGTTTEVVIAVAQPIVLVTITTTMLLGVVSATTLFLTFFAPASYRSWLSDGAQETASA